MDSWMRRLFSPGEPASGGGGEPAAKPDPAPEPEPETKTEPAPEPTDDPRLKQARDEAIKERKKRQELAARIEKIEADNTARSQAIAKALGLKGDDEDPAAAAEKARTDLEAMRAKAATALIRNQVTIAAQAAGAVDPDAIFRLGDFAEVQVDLDRGTVTGVDEIVKALIEAKPYLKAPKTGATPAGGAPPASDPHSANAGIEEIEAKIKAARAGDHDAELWITKNLGAIRKAGYKVK